VELLDVDRIDHGNACLDDPELVQDLVRKHTPLTVCPLSNLRLKLVPSPEVHPLKRMLDAGLLVTVNSDDPAYFGGYITENLVVCQEALALSLDDIATLPRNGFSAAFIAADEASSGRARVDAYVERHRRMFEAAT
jgi:adenosine deaminase